MNRSFYSKFYLLVYLFHEIYHLYISYCSIFYCCYDPWPISVFLVIRRFMTSPLITAHDRWVSRNRQARLFLIKFKKSFKSVRQGNHIVFREYSFISSTPYNRACFIQKFLETYNYMISRDGNTKWLSRSFFSKNRNRVLKFIYPHMVREAFKSANFYQRRIIYFKLEYRKLPPFKIRPISKS